MSQLGTEWRRMAQNALVGGMSKWQRMAQYGAQNGADWGIVAQLGAEWRRMAQHEAEWR